MDKKIVESLAEVEATEGTEYAEIQGFVPGQVFRIGSLTAGDLIEWSEANEGEQKRTAGLRLITKSLVNAAGVRYASDDAKAVEIFRRKSHKVTERIVSEILKLNGMNVKADAAAKND